MSITCPSSTALTDVELSHMFSNGSRPGILPQSSPNTSDREANGMINASTLNAIILNLQTSNVIPNSKKIDSDVFFKNQKILLADIKSEYCFYYSRYSGSHFSTNRPLCSIFWILLTH